MDRYEHFVNNFNEKKPSTFAFYNILYYVNNDEFGGVVINPGSENFFISKNMILKFIQVIEVWMSIYIFILFNSSDDNRIVLINEILNTFNIMSVIKFFIPALITSLIGIILFILKKRFIERLSIVVNEKISLFNLKNTIILDF